MGQMYELYCDHFIALTPYPGIAGIATGQFASCSLKTSPGGRDTQGMSLYFTCEQRMHRSATFYLKWHQEQIKNEEKRRLKLKRPQWPSLFLCRQCLNILMKYTAAARDSIYLAQDMTGL